MAPVVATKTKHLRWLLARSTLAPYAPMAPTLALANCLCGSPSVDTSWAAATNLTALAQRLQQISLLGHSSSLQSLRRRQQMLQPTRWSHLMAAL